MRRPRLRLDRLPGFGAIDLAVTWSPDWPQVLEAGWGLYFTVLLGAPFVGAAHDRGAAAPGVPQLALRAAALAVSGVAARETGALVRQDRRGDLTGLRKSKSKIMLLIKFSD